MRDVRQLVVEQLKNTYPFYTDPAMPSMFGETIRLLPGGLITFSKWPIVLQRYIPFRSCDGADCMIGKGVVYTRIDKEGQFINVFNLHLQAWRHATNTRRAQIHELETFIKVMRIPREEPVLVVGDYNIDMYEQHADITDMCRQIGGTVVPLDRRSHTFTSDPSRNELVGNDDPDAYRTMHVTDGCYDTFLETGRCTCCPQELIDHIIYLREHAQPINDPTAMIHIITAEREFLGRFNIFHSKLMKDISDHYPISCSFQFPRHHTTTIDPHHTIGVNTYHVGWLSLQITLFILYIFLFTTLIQLVQRYVRRLRPHNRSREMSDTNSP
jgi:endonuclease/exonuclease/phosphatase family metal-dependent hydrolase